ncbi:eukaryotic aspartyl protease family protein [Actinidia rufa]|uniref:Eukaryotic aspartyl protease family protein n=1 Tax=Actinidia rufa TaxID=165716 RepID=A0A7J0HDX9_9ERIC|nr:eukaryotic aspartyl protease family protein [Actinidia rufa]
MRLLSPLSLLLALSTDLSTADYLKLPLLHRNPFQFPPAALSTTARRLSSLCRSPSSQSPPPPPSNPANGVKLPMSPSVWAIDALGNGGTVVDSGTTLTFLAELVYNKILAQFKLRNLKLRFGLGTQESQGRHYSVLTPPPRIYFLDTAEGINCLSLQPVTLPSGFSVIGNLMQQGEMVPDLAISLISSLPSPLLHGLVTIFLSLISPPIGLQIHPRLEMGRTGVPLSVVTRLPRGGENTGLPSCWGRRTGTGEARAGEEEQGLGTGEEEQGQRLSLSRLNQIWGRKNGDLRIYLGKLH